MSAIMYIVKKVGEYLKQKREEKDMSLREAATLAGRWSGVCDSFRPGDVDEWTETTINGVNVFVYGRGCFHAARVSGR